ncbi:hypothetical protein HK096_000466, partial [Nowakowskiella sp. JEL0078]
NRVEVNIFHGHDNGIKALTVDSENGCLISGGISGKIKIWNLDVIADSESHVRSLLEVSQDVQDIAKFSVLEFSIVKPGELVSISADGTLHLHHFGL